MKKDPTIVYTIGHSNHTWERFLDLICPHQIDLLVDVRSYPRSRFAPWSNRKRLQQNLSQFDIDYLWQGDTLGGKPRGPKPQTTADEMTDDDWYQTRRSATDFLAAVAVISRAAEAKRLAVLCSEGDPTRCHRKLLLEPAFQSQDVEIRHIDPKSGEILLGFDLTRRGMQGELKGTPTSP